jgi:transcriptional regulator with XRE-family HTH domain
LVLSVWHLLFNLGVPAGTFWSWIYRNDIPDARTACAIAESLGVTVEYLVRGTDDVNGEDRNHKTFERKSATDEIRKLAQKIVNETERLR